MKFSEYADIEEIIIRKLTGAAGKRDLHAIEEWRSQSEGNEAAYHLLQKVWNEQSPETLHPDYQELEEEIWAMGHRPDQELRRRVLRRSLLYKIASAITLICVVSWFVTRMVPEEEIAAVPQEQVYTYNPTGQKSKITLPDNSIIYLNSESSLSYQKGFSDSVRYIQLDGEAYFEVQPDLDRPFVVETGGISTIALGTSFNIRNYPEECTIQVSLVSGKVKVTDSQASNEVLLEPFEQVKFLKQGRTLKMTQMEHDLVSVWKDGIINFKGSSFDQVIRTLERSYDVVIDTADYTTTDWSYTGKFDNMSLEIVLTRIGYSEGFNFDIDGRLIKISDDHK